MNRPPVLPLLTILLTFGLFSNNQVIAYQSKIDDQGQRDAEVDSKSVIRSETHLECSDFVRLKNETGGPTAIIYLVADRAFVKKGDLVIQLDDSRLQDKLAQQNIIVNNQQSHLDGLKSKLRIRKAEFEFACELAKSKIDLAALNAERVLGEEGRLGLERDGIKAQLVLTNRELSQRIEQQKTNSSTSTQHVKPTTLPTEIAAMTAKIKRLESRLRFINGPESAFQTASTKLEMRQAEVELQLANTRFDSMEKELTVELVDLQRRLGYERETLDSLRLQIELCNIYAPRDGRFVYANHIDHWRVENDQMIEEGASVEALEVIAILPNMNRLQVQMALNEKQVVQVKKGLVATVRFPKLLGRSFRGTVVNVPDTPTLRSWRESELQYLVTIELNETPNNVEIGSTAEVEIDTKNQDESKTR